MALNAGMKLGPYEIVSPLGAGGMGEVYRARDARLDREVAIKVLPEAFARDAERVARFQREAKLLASLNHPHIAAIYGFEEANAIRFLVLELVEGETLAERLQAGSLPIEDALHVGRQIAEAVEAAHEQGVIHRDLKPGNVKITADGKVKVLDFGLAKALSADTSASSIQHSPTITMQHTSPGVVLGTAAYMSPEQARGKPVDKRTDIWSFGILLYECLGGHRPFDGETTSDLIARILEREPDWSALPPGTPPTVQLLLRRCLAKDRNKRLRDIGDARIELNHAIADPTSSSLGLAADAMAAGSLRHDRGRRRLASTAAWIALAGILAALISWNLKPEPQTPVRRFTIADKDYEPAQGIAISPDGRKIVFSAKGRLWVREIDRLEPRELPGTDNATQPIWSPDSTRIAYATENKLWHIPSQGGTPTAIGTLPGAVLPVGGLSWTEDERIMVATGNAGLYEVSARGGEMRTILDVDPATEEDFHHAASLPGGRGVLFTIHRRGGGPDKIDLWTPAGRKTLLEMEGERFDNPVYSPTGHILYTRSTTTPGLWALPFSPSDLAVTGAPFLVAPDAERASVSQDGTLVYFRGTASVLQHMVWVSREGELLGAVGQAQPVLDRPRLSPDGTRIAVAARDPDSRNLWIHDIARGTKMRLTFDRLSPSGPIWIPGRNAIAHSTGSGAKGSAWIRQAGGSGEAEELPITFPTSCSSDGKFLLYQVEDDNGTDDLWYVRLDGEGEPKPLIQGRTQDRNGVFSPDGSLVAYEYRDSGLEEVFLTNFPSGEGRWQVSVNSGTEPRWSPKGDE
ncbi:MAG: protein kinase, partial [Phycisphaerales bacterium]|nr:protein kinase [Phycisphaerales bacterium]